MLLILPISISHAFFLHTQTTVLFEVAMCPSNSIPSLLTAELVE